MVNRSATTRAIGAATAAVLDAAIDPWWGPKTGIPPPNFSIPRVDARLRRVLPVLQARCAVGGPDCRRPPTERQNTAID